MPEPLTINSPSEIVDTKCGVCHGAACFYILAYPAGATNRMFVCSSAACTFIATGQAANIDIHMTLNAIKEVV